MAGNVFKNVLAIISKLSLDIDVELVTNTEEITKTRYVEEKPNHLIMRIDKGDNNVSHINMQTLALEKYEAIIISDYNKGSLLEEDIEYICSRNPNVFLDTKKILGDFCLKAKFIKINHTEYSNSKAFFDEESFSKQLIVTLGSKGCRYDQTLFPVEAVEIRDLVGAGDTFLAALTVNYMTTGNIVEALNFANYCATQVIQHRGVKVLWN